MKIVNIAQVSNVVIVVVVVFPPTNNEKAVMQAVKEEVVDTTDVNRFDMTVGKDIMKKKDTHVEKCVIKKKHVGKNNYVGKFVHNKGKEQFVKNA